MARTCDACDALIDQLQYVELMARVLDPTESQDQDAAKQVYRDYCNECLRAGRALTHVLTELKWSDPAVPAERN